MGGDNQTAENWKYKYLELLEKLEDKERHYERFEAVLRKGMGRLALGCQGHDGTLDRKLDELRTALNSGAPVDELGALINTIGDCLRKLDEPSAVSGEGSSSIPALLRGMLDAVRFQADQLGVLADIRSELDAADAESDFAQLARKVGRLISESQVTAASAPDSPVHDALLEMLECLSFPEPFVGRVRDVKSLLLAGKDGQTKASVQNVTRLVADMRSFLEAEKHTLEIFLHQLSDRLQELDILIGGAGEEHRAALDSARELDVAVSSEVSGLQSVVNDIDNVDDMKVAIQTRVERITYHLASKREKDAARKASLELQLAKMAEHLKSVEGEAQVLRQRLEEERQNAQLDPLTEVHNRLAYEVRIKEEFARWQRYQHPLTLLLLDIDNFKAINDNYGHKAGDKALIVIAKTIQEHVRTADFFARIGGEEFILLLPETKLNEAQLVAEKLRESVASCVFVYKGKPVPVTISGGVSQFKAKDSVDDAFMRADKALYQAKSGGRNKIMLG